MIRRKSLERAIALSGFVALLPACATVMYDGPMRPDDQVATIIATRTRITRIDARDSSQDGGGFAILPGTHVVVAYLRDYNRFSYETQAVCFEAEKGRTYQTNPRYVDDRRWELGIVEEYSSEPVPVRRVESWSRDCARAETFTPAPHRLTLTPPRLVADSSAAPAVGPETPPAVTTPGAVPGPAPAVAAQAPAGAGASPGQRRGAQGATIHRPGNGFGFEMGGAFGGDEVARAIFTDGHTETIHAGGGVVLAVGGAWTPVWIGQVLGLGLATSIGYKASEIADDNGNSLRLTSVPWDLSVQALLALQRHWYLLLRGGVQKELDVHFSGRGIAAPVDLFLTAPFGAQMEGGLMAYGSFSAFALTVRSSAVRYQAAGTSVDASSVAILGSLYFYF